MCHTFCKKISIWWSFFLMASTSTRRYGRLPLGMSPFPLPSEIFFSTLYHCNSKMVFDSIKYDLLLCVLSRIFPCFAVLTWNSYSAILMLGILVSLCSQAGFYLQMDAGHQVLEWNRGFQETTCVQLIWLGSLISRQTISPIRKPHMGKHKGNFGNGE